MGNIVACPFFSGLVASFFLAVNDCLAARTEIPASSLQKPAKSQGELLFYLDTASFRAAPGKTLQEFYYEIPLSQLDFQPRVEGLQSEISTAVSIRDSTGNLLLQDEWKQPVMAKSRAEIEGRLFPSQFELTMTPGRYRLTLLITDLHAHKQGRAELAFQVRDFAHSFLTLSDVQIASSISGDTSEAKFVKNGFNVVPNPSRLFGKSQPILYFYFEIYNFSAAADSYEIHYAVLNERQEVARRLPTKIAVKPGEQGVEVGGVHVGNLSDSTYFLRVEAKDRSTGATAAVEKSFRKPVTASAALSVVANRLNAMSEAEFKAHLEYLQYLLRAEEKEMLSAMEMPAQKRFLIEFWNRLDPQPATAENEFWDEYFRRLEYANANFTSGFSTGWKSDKGRVAIKFGIPNDIERYPAQVNSRPYEVWSYYRDGGKKFIFADIDGFGKYELIYSSDERELTRPDWKLIIDAR